MSAITYSEAFTPEQVPAPERVYSCPQCSHWIPEGTLACPDCHTLIYGEHLNRLAAAAARAEHEGKRLEARELWTQALDWLPADARQAEQIRQHIAGLDGQQQAESDREARWKKRLGPLAPIALAIFKFKSALFLLFKLKFLLGFVGFFGLYWAMFGWKFALGFTISILIHEMGHYIAVRARGLKADLPMFLPGLGAYVRWYHQGMSLGVLAQIALFGPLFGLGAALASIGLFAVTHQPVFQAIAYVGAWTNLINLIPVLGLDGAQATYALTRLQRGLVLAACIILFALMHEGVFLFLAAGMTYRMFTNDTPEQESIGTLVGYLLLLFALGAFLYIIPDPGQFAR
ncbi:site-2 protease family protein [Terriglobus aquaticus]|uniref:Site-2 protease family protein n=1 Tax=Terriglobus aquaticus TaxID=940139 RepID=A0ABW9KRE4_9BACT|nr:site-2 protease family protein [Terriglobus aquaticus]